MRRTGNQRIGIEICIVFVRGYIDGGGSGDGDVRGCNRLVFIDGDHIVVQLGPTRCSGRHPIDVVASDHAAIVHEPFGPGQIDGSVVVDFVLDQARIESLGCGRWPCRADNPKVARSIVDPCLTQPAWCGQIGCCAVGGDHDGAYHCRRAGVLNGIGQCGTAIGRVCVAITQPDRLCQYGEALDGKARFFDQDRIRDGARCLIQQGVYRCEVVIDRTDRHGVGEQSRRAVCMPERE